MTPGPDENDAAVQHAVDHATEGPDAATLASEVEQAAAAAHLAHLGSGTLEPLPASLRARLAADASRFHTHGQARPPGHSRRREWLGWGIAAAAVTLLFVRPQPQGPAYPRTTPDTTIALQAGLASAPDALRLSLASGTGSGSGQLLWSTSLQRGLLRVHGLPPNNPATHQYQIWIVDPLRDPELPVDAGVFDVRPDGSAEIAFTPSRPITLPRAFAITREVPGGVVRSRAPSPVLAARYD